MTTLIEILRADFWAAAAVGSVALVAIAYLFVITVESMKGDGQ